MLGEGLVRRVLFGVRAARTSCALRAVILPAVQSLRRSCSEAACRERGLLGGGLAGGVRNR